MYVEHPEIKIQDAAKGCLLQLGVLDDEAAKHANKVFDSSGSGQSYDVFLSHKRTDAKDFARALYNLLVLRGVATFLDFEYQEELQLETGLSELVASCRNFVFVLTDNVLASKWCLQELEAAVDNRINIVLVVKEGSRWKDEEGRKTTPFPGPNIIAELPDKVKPVFTRKAIHHSDEYYSSFIEMLMKKVTANKPTPPEESTSTCQSRAAMSAPTDLLRLWWMAVDVVRPPLCQQMLLFAEQRPALTACLCAAYVSLSRREAGLQRNECSQVMNDMLAKRMICKPPTGGSCGVLASCKPPTGSGCGVLASAQAACCPARTLLATTVLHL
uniref:TIR domain-containing protein n=1 Tax=Dunaliella tertiolecta TaxID=3047 RepID=A0A7S3R452_DUNTE